MSKDKKPEWEELGIDKETYIMNYLNDRYGEEFLFSKDLIDPWDAEFDIMYFESVRFPGEPVLVRRNFETGKLDDNYMKLYLSEDIEKILDELVSEVYGNAKVFYTTDGSRSNSKSYHMTDEEYLATESKYGGISFSILLEDDTYPKNRDRDIELLRQVFEKNEYKANISILYLTEGRLDKADKYTWGNIFTGIVSKEEFLGKGSFSMDADYKFSNSYWRESDE